MRTFPSVAAAILAVSSSAFAQDGVPLSEVELRAAVAVAEARAAAQVAAAEAQKVLAEAAASVAQEKEASAQAAAAAAKRAEEAKKGELAEDKNASMLLSGLTAGVAVAIQNRFAKIDGTQQVTSNATAMPYVMIHPAYWGTPEATRQACVANWGGSSEDVAHLAAMSVARKSASQIYDGVEAQLSVRGFDDTDVASDSAILSLGKSLGLRSSLRQETDAETDSAIKFSVISVYRVVHDAAPDKSELRKKVVDGIASFIWKPALIARCFWKKVGAWVGFPLDYKADFKVDKRRELSMDSIIAFGAGFSPNKYLSLLIGVTAGRVSYKPDGSDGEERRRSMAFTVGLGGNVDILTKLVKILGG